MLLAAYQNCGKPVISSSSESATASRLPLLLLHPGLDLDVGLFLLGAPVYPFLVVKGAGLEDFAFGNARRACKAARAFCGGLIEEHLVNQCKVFPAAGRCGVKLSYVQQTAVTV